MLSKSVSSALLFPRHCSKTCWTPRGARNKLQGLAMRSRCHRIAALPSFPPCSCCHVVRKHVITGLGCRNWPVLHGVVGAWGTLSCLAGVRVRVAGCFVVMRGALSFVASAHLTASWDMTCFSIESASRCTCTRPHSWERCQQRTDVVGTQRRERKRVQRSMWHVCVWACVAVSHILRMSAR